MSGVLVCMINKITIFFQSDRKELKLKTKYKMANRNNSEAPPPSYNELFPAQCGPERTSLPQLRGAIPPPLPNRREIDRRVIPTAPPEEQSGHFSLDIRAVRSHNRRVFPEPPSPIELPTNDEAVPAPSQRELPTNDEVVPAPSQRELPTNGEVVPAASATEVSRSATRKSSCFQRIDNLYEFKPPCERLKLSFVVRAIIVVALTIVISVCVATIKKPGICQNYCPENCRCSETVVDCKTKGLTSIPSKLFSCTQTL
ncbi:unnamed protein product, partial [Owenia fusiformis]